MTGSLQIKKNNYYAVLNMYDAYGKRKAKWISTGISAEKGNKRKAESALRNILNEYESKNTAYSKEIPFLDWLEQSVQSEKHNVELSTWEGWEYYMRAHLRPFFKKLNVTLTGLRAEHIQQYYDEKIENGRMDGKGGLSASTIKKHSMLFRCALIKALKLNLIAYNPMDKATRPKIKHKFVGSFYNLQQSEQLMEVVKGTVIESAVILALHYGFRRCEALGLKWSAIDFDNDTLIVKHTIVRQKTIQYKDSTKNKSSYRTLPLLPNVKTYLKQLRIKQKEQQLLFGSDYVVNDYVCKRADGRTFNPDFVSSKFSKILKAAGLPHIRFHDLRHTTASLLIAQGFGLKEVQEWLGHADIGTTADIYGHLEYKAKINMANELNNMLKLSI